MTLGCLIFCSFLFHTTLPVKHIIQMSMYLSNPLFISNPPMHFNFPVTSEANRETVYFPTGVLTMNKVET